MTRLRLGIIGTGVAARILHWPALEQLSDRYQIVAVANRSRDKGEAFADLVGLERVSVYTDFRELLARDDLDIVDLVLPPQLNYTMARAAAEAGLHIICEKPIEVRLKKAGQPDVVYAISGPSSFCNEFEDFYRALVKGTPPLVTPMDALRDLETVLAAHHSSLSGEVVHLTRGYQP